MEKIFVLNNDYSGDIEKIKEWYAPDIEQSKALKNFFVVVTPYILLELQGTPGLEYDLDFMCDIYDRTDLTVGFISLVRVAPFVKTGPWLSKFRTKVLSEGDKIFDDAVPNRHCTIIVPLIQSEITAFHWINSETKLNEGDIYKKFFDIVDLTYVPNRPFLLRGDQAVLIDNQSSSGYFYFLQIGFECNPTYEEVKEQFLRLP